LLSEDSGGRAIKLSAALDAATNITRRTTISYGVTKPSAMARAFFSLKVITPSDADISSSLWSGWKRPAANDDRSRCHLPEER